MNKLNYNLVRAQMKHIYVRGQKRKTTSCGTEKSPPEKSNIKNTS